MALSDVVAGNEIIASELRDAFDEIDTTEAWTSYTPTWSSSGTQPALGNGTIIGGYTTKGKLAFVRATLIMGSTTTYGTGTWRMSLPGAITSVANYQSGALLLLDNGTAEKAGIVYTHTDLDKVSLVSATAAVTATSPHTWTNGDYFSFSLTLEIT